MCSTTVLLKFSVLVSSTYFGRILTASLKSLLYKGVQTQHNWIALVADPWAWKIIGPDLNNYCFTFVCGGWHSSCYNLKIVRHKGVLCMCMCVCLLAMETVTAITHTSHHSIYLHTILASIFSVILVLFMTDTEVQ